MALQDIQWRILVKAIAFPILASVAAILLVTLIIVAIVQIPSMPFFGNIFLILVIVPILFMFFCIYYSFIYVCRNTYPHHLKHHVFHAIILTTALLVYLYLDHYFETDIARKRMLLPEDQNTFLNIFGAFVFMSVFSAFPYAYFTWRIKPKLQEATK